MGSKILKRSPGVKPDAPPEGYRAWPLWFVGIAFIHNRRFGMLFVAGTAGPAGAMVANLTHPSIHATALATLTLANNLLGLAPGPFLTGVIADRVGLLGAMQFAPILAVGAAAAFFIGRRHYERDLQRLEARFPPPR